MRLRSLLDHGLSPDWRVEVPHGQDHWPELEITGLGLDSRALVPGMLFAALPGSSADGRRFIDQAIANGAAAILTDPSQAGHARPLPVILDPRPRRRLALMAARFYARQPDTVVAITGTSGKTSTASFTRQLWQRLGHKAAALGTLGLDGPGGRRAGGLTTPDPIRLHALLAELAGEGIQHLALEASSHGLDQARLDGVRLRAAAFTNLSRDHFDYHGSAAAYLAAKRRLFAELLPVDGTAVLNADVPEFADLRALCAERGLRVIDYGVRAEVLRLAERSELAEGQRFTVLHGGRPATVTTPLVGAFQIANLLAALGLVLGSAPGIDAAAAIAALGSIEGAPGRLQLVGRHPCGAPVFVDYAHKPDALATVLATLRPHAQAALAVLFGCGGDRDPGKRALMGAIAQAQADRVYVTDDNPRSEDPAEIRRAVLAACPKAVEIGDRAAAIRAAVAGLRSGDVLVVAGKGHETGQIVGAQVLPFDDAMEVRKALAELDGVAA